MECKWCHRITSEKPLKSETMGWGRGIAINSYCSARGLNAAQGLRNVQALVAHTPGGLGGHKPQSCWWTNFGTKMQTCRSFLWPPISVLMTSHVNSDRKPLWIWEWLIIMKTMKSMKLNELSELMLGIKIIHARQSSWVHYDCIYN